MKLAIYVPNSVRNDEITCAFYIDGLSGDADGASSVYAGMSGMKW